MKLISFLNEVKVELKKITWPGKDELLGSTVIVCILVIVFAVILGGMDAGFSSVINRLISF